jgi:hypothetical protein
MPKETHKASGGISSGAGERIFMVFQLRLPLTKAVTPLAGRKIYAFHKLKLYQSPKAFDQHSFSFCLSLTIDERDQNLSANSFPITGSRRVLLPWVLLASLLLFYSSPFGLPIPGSLFNQDITFYQLPPTAEGSKNLLNVRQARV